MKKFKVGNRVKAIKPIGLADKIGVHGTVIDVDFDRCMPYLVEFDNYINGHDGDTCEIDLIKQKENEPLKNFKVNDDVLINTNHYQNERGTIFRVNKYKNKPYEYDVYVHGDGMVKTFLSNEIKNINEIYNNDDFSNRVLKRLLKLHDAQITCAIADAIMSEIHIDEGKKNDHN